MSESPERKDKILIVIPAFNEEEKIHVVVQEIRREVPEAVVLVVNDGSRDQTETRARAVGQVLPTLSTWATGSLCRPGINMP
jgi:glycosyltransferase involved in cell wall biosynthesis